MGMSSARNVKFRFRALKSRPAGPSGVLRCAAEDFDGWAKLLKKSISEWALPRRFEMYDRVSFDRQQKADETNTARAWIRSSVLWPLVNQP